ncbi:MAG: YggT family protein [Marmoricola sp.]
MHLVGQIVHLVLFCFLVLLLIRLVVDWIQMFARAWQPSGPLVVVLESVYTLTDPPVKALRRLIPPLRLGQMMLDLSFLVLIVVVYVLLRLDESFLLG